MGVILQQFSKSGKSLTDKEDKACFARFDSSGKYMMHGWKQSASYVRYYHKAPAKYVEFLKKTMFKAILPEDTVKHVDLQKRWCYARVCMVGSLFRLAEENPDTIKHILKYAETYTPDEAFFLGVWKTQYLYSHGHPANDNVYGILNYLPKRLKCLWKFRAGEKRWGYSSDKAAFTAPKLGGSWFKKKDQYSIKPRYNWIPNKYIYDCKTEEEVLDYIYGRKLPEGSR